MYKNDDLYTGVDAYTASGVTKRKNTRVAVTLTEEQYDAVTRLSQRQGCSRGAFLLAILDQALPGFVRIAQLYETADRASEQQRESVRQGMSKAEGLLSSALDVVGQLTMNFEEELGVAGEERGAPSRGGTGSSPAPSRPPHTNRGVRGTSDGGS